MPEKEEFSMSFCKNCGGNIADGAAFCPVCGQAVNIAANNQYQPHYSPNYNPPYQNTTVKTNGIALAGFIIGCVSLLINLWGLVVLAALIMSIIGCVQISSGKGKGNAFAVAGIIIGAFSLIFGVCFTLFLASA